jgi:hypothetical protein
MQIVKKLSSKTIIGNVLTAFTIDEKTKQPVIGELVALFSVVGIANTIKTGTSTYGDWQSFKGTFEATNLLTGEVFRAGELFLPEVAENMLTGPVTQHGEVKFGFEIGARSVKDRTNDQIVKYEFTCKPLLDTAENDPIAALKAELPALQLEAPAAKTAKKK